mgnify:CR=1 FL=1
MNEARVYADGFERSFAEVKDLLEFLAERGRNAKWIRKPTNTLRLAPLEKEAQNLDAADASMEEILEDTEKNTQLVLKMRGESYPVRDCAIRTILSRAGVNGDGLRKLDKATYAKVVNYCLRVAKGDALIKIADGKVSAVHGGDKHDYCILDMKAMFETTCEYLNLNFKGSVYMEGSGIYDHSIVSAMWKLGGSQELLDTYRKALDAHEMDEKILSPALRFTTSDVAASGANLYLLQRWLCNHLQKFSFCKNWNTKALGFCQFAAGFFPADQVIGFLCYRAARFGTKLQNLIVDTVSGKMLQFPCCYDGTSCKFVFFCHNGLFLSLFKCEFVL